MQQSILCYKKDLKKLRFFNVSKLLPCTQNKRWHYSIIWFSLVSRSDASPVRIEIISMRIDPRAPTTPKQVSNISFRGNIHADIPTEIICVTKYLAGVDIAIH